MYILLTDETNVSPSATSEFFVTGGLFFPMDTLSALHSEIAKIRKTYGYRPTDALKFNTHDRPKHVAQADVNAAKAKVVKTCAALECRFIAYVVLHKIATKTHQIQWGLDAILRSFDLFLGEARQDGIAIFDRPPIPKPHEYFTDKFCNGLVFPKEGAKVDLQRIKLFGSTCINASHASSAMDIVLGSFRYAINERSKPTAGLLMRQIAPMMWGERDGTSLNVFERGLIMRPQRKSILVAGYGAKYDELTTYFNDLVKAL